MQEVQISHRENRMLLAGQLKHYLPNVKKVQIYFKQKGWRKNSYWQTFADSIPALRELRIADMQTFPYLHRFVEHFPDKLEQLQIADRDALKHDIRGKDANQASIKVLIQ